MNELPCELVQYVMVVMDDEAGPLILTCKAFYAASQTIFQEQYGQRFVDIPGGFDEVNWFSKYQVRKLLDWRWDPDTTAGAVLLLDKCVLGQWEGERREKRRRGGAQKGVDGM